eukprot:6916296-Prymnesium_polylepis.1
MSHNWTEALVDEAGRLNPGCPYPIIDWASAASFDNFHHTVQLLRLLPIYFEYPANVQEFVEYARILVQMFANGARKFRPTFANISLDIRGVFTKVRVVSPAQR